MASSKIRKQEISKVLALARQREPGGFFSLLATYYD
jgi:hypothetical protein